MIKSLPVRQAGVKSKNLCKSLPRRQAGVIQTNYDRVKTHGGELTVMSTFNEGLLDGSSTEFKISLPI